MIRILIKKETLEGDLVKYLSLNASTEILVYTK